MTEYRCDANWMYPNAQGNWRICDPFYAGIIGAVTSSAFGGGAAGNSMLNAYGNSAPKPTRKDLTPRQIEWCRANIPAFMPRVINAPR